MHIKDFKEVVKKFADPGSSLLHEKDKLIFSVNGNLIDINITQKNGDIYVIEEGIQQAASYWITRRLANLPLLAARIKENIREQKDFVTPSAEILSSLEDEPSEKTEHTNNALISLIKTLSKSAPFETSVLYLTSDAGEGKTSLINAAAREQAKRFSNNESDWLLVPITLGGRHFLRFDDITVGALQNKYRFPFLYFDSFLTLVKMGVIVPAFDGFEEMFVENSSGEALSAMGILVDALDSSGTVLVAARKAYFEFENLRSQERLFDTISANEVSFMKLQLCRWNREKFIEYCGIRDVSNSDSLYQKIKDRLGENHSLLTRPVLVRRLIDIAEENQSLDYLLERINLSGADFFYTFIRGIIDREATEKWLDRSGEVGANLLSTDEHCTLLAMIAASMWEMRVEYLKRDNLELVTDVFCESTSKTAPQTQQIRERIRGHALFVHSTAVNSAIEFDHDEFRQFFLGNGLADLFKGKSKQLYSEVLNLLKRGLLPENSQLAFIQSISRNEDLDRVIIADILNDISKLDSQASYTHENCTRLIIRLLSGEKSTPLEFENLNFGVDCLRDSKLCRIYFKSCYFSNSSLELTNLDDCKFIDCTFAQLKLFPSTLFGNVSFENCRVESIKLETEEIEIWDPKKCLEKLQSLGIEIINEEDLASNGITLEKDDDLINIEKILRYFMRSTHISESVIKIKLGEKGQYFIDNCLPDLLQECILVEIDNKGGALQRRFKLGKPLQQLNASLASAGGSFSKFKAGVN